MGTWEILIIVFASLLVLSVSLTTLIKKVSLLLDIKQHYL